MKPTDPILPTLMYLPPEYRKQVIDRFNEVNTEIERLRFENARLRGELQAYEILDAAGRINREVSDVF